MSSLVEDLESNTDSLKKAELARHYTIWGTLLFVCAIILLAFGGAMPFTGGNAFLTFLGFFFALVAAIAYGQNYVLSEEVARKEGSKDLQQSSRGMLVMCIVSALIAAACIVSLIVS